MARWTCPECGREFAVARQGHFCAPGVPVDDVFAGRPPALDDVDDELLGWLTEAYDYATD